MNKTELIDRVAYRTGCTKKVTEEIILATIDEIFKALSEGEEVKFVGFGKFLVKKRAGHIGRNPKTGEEVRIPSTYRPFFVPGKPLKQAVQEGNRDE